MEEEYFLNRAAIVHGGMAARYCYCGGIEGTVLFKSFTDNREPSPLML